MGQFDEKYSRAEKDAVASYWLDRKVRPAAAICRLAEAGELEHEGKRLPKFRISEAMVRHEGAKLRKQRHGELRTQLAAVTPRDAVESLRKRLVSAVDHEMQRIEREQQGALLSGDPIDGTRLTKLASAVDRIAKLPIHDEAIPLPRGHKREAAKASAPLGQSLLNAATGAGHDRDTVEDANASPAAGSPASDTHPDATAVDIPSVGEHDPYAPDWIRDELTADSVSVGRA